MAPKTRGASSSAVGKKRKTVVRRPVRQPTPESSESSTPQASPAHSTAQVDPLAGRVIVMGRKMDFELFEEEGFLVGRQICEMGWEKICSIDCPTYPSLVKDFYKNLARGDNGIVSTVRNTRINISVSSLSRLLSLPTSGPATFNPEDRCSAISKLVNREVEEFEEVLANQLSLELRLLHNICSRILFPKSGRFDYVSERDVFVMDAVISGKPINLPSMILWYMADCALKKRACLPYGMIITQILRSQGVLISDSEPQRCLRHTDFYSLATIHRMGFIKKDGHWIRKNQSEERATDVDAPGPSVSIHSARVRIDPTPTPAPASSSADLPLPTQSSNSFSEVQLAQLKRLLDTQKDDMNNAMEERFMSLRQELYSLDERLGKIESTLGTSCNNLKEDLKKIFEGLGEFGGDAEIYSKCNAELQEKIITACTFLDRRLNDFVKTQSEGMHQIQDRLIGIIKTNL